MTYYEEMHTYLERSHAFPNKIQIVLLEFRLLLYEIIYASGKTWDWNANMFTKFY